MSLVLDALRRVDKPDKSGSVGVAVSSFRPPRRRRILTLPLLLGLATGAAILIPFKLSPTDPRHSTASSAPLESLATAPQPPLSIQRPGAQLHKAGESEPRSPSSGSSDAAIPASDPKEPRGLFRSRTIVSNRSQPASLTLQAISERDSSPIAIINDQLVREGDLIGRIRILRIDSDSVDVLLANGKKETVRFAPPLLPEPSPLAAVR